MYSFKNNLELNLELTKRKESPCHIEQNNQALYPKSK